MKRFILISVLMAFFGNAFSQEIKTDTTFIVNSNKIQVVDGKNGLKIKVYEMTQDGYVSVNPYYEISDIKAVPFNVGFGLTL